MMKLFCLEEMMPAGEIHPGGSRRKKFFRKFLKKQQNSKIKRGVFLASYFLPLQYPRKYAYENSCQSLNIYPPLFLRLEMSFDISANGFT